MEAAFETEFERKLFRYRQTILQTNHRETVRTIDSIFDLIAARHRSEFAKPHLDADGCFASR